MFSFFKKEKWALVKTTTFTRISWGEKKDGVIYIHFFESEKGNRKIESACSFVDATQEKIDDFIKGSGLYQTKIFRWLNGRYDPEIPRYSEIGEEDTVSALRGKVE
jgi:hypothetical protein